MGKIRVPKSEDEPEELVQAIHEPLVNEELFYQVHYKLEYNKQECNKATRTIKVREELPLRGHLICSNCKELMTGSASFYCSLTQIAE